MSLVSVIGIGNRLFGDDGVGCEVARALAERNGDGRIDYRIGETDIGWCLAQITAPRLVILDAVRMGANPGSVRDFRLEDRLLPPGRGLSMHNGHWLSFLCADRAKKGLLIGIEPYALTPSFGLSEPMERDFGRILKAARGILSAYVLELERPGPD